MSNLESIIVCLNQFIRPEIHLELHGVGNCLICKTHEDNKKCYQYEPIKLFIKNIGEKKLLENKIDDISNMMNWMSRSLILNRDGSYETFSKIIDKCPSCKPYIRQDNLQYEDCAIQKWNYAYEKHWRCIILKMCETIEIYHKRIYIKGLVKFELLRKRW